MTTITKTRLAAVALAGTMLAGVATVPAVAQLQNGFGASRDQATEMMNRIAREHGYEDVAFVEQKKKHIEAYTTDDAGNRVEIKVDRWGNLDKIEVEYGWARPSFGGYASEADIRRNIEAAGYEMLFVKDRDDDEYEIMARNSRGDVVELEVSFSGQVLKSEYKAQKYAIGNFVGERDRGDRRENSREERRDRDDRGPRHERGDDRRG
ncbi:PepSY domain-containing protein [Aliihoeflea sp. 2WW]|uniref:PepSY domain-containing protein n=1 Tax=Aliihoeflea sp. 2WW TaxID=1381123 RepID=UPI0004674539|nr:PepSY domain-containing protein [Aliihoeflea sp. 2WW]